MKEIVKKVPTRLILFFSDSVNKENKEKILNDYLNIFQIPPEKLKIEYSLPDTNRNLIYADSVWSIVLKSEGLSNKDIINQFEVWYNNYSINYTKQYPDSGFQSFSIEDISTKNIEKMKENKMAKSVYNLDVPAVPEENKQFIKELFNKYPIGVISNDFWTLNPSDSDFKILTGIDMEEITRKYGEWNNMEVTLNFENEKFEIYWTVQIHDTDIPELAGGYVVSKDLQEFLKNKTALMQVKLTSDDIKTFASDIEEAVKAFQKNHNNNRLNNDDYRVLTHDSDSIIIEGTRDSFQKLKKEFSINITSLNEMDFNEKFEMCRNLFKGIVSSMGDSNHTDFDSMWLYVSKCFEDGYKVGNDVVDRNWRLYNTVSRMLYDSTTNKIYDNFALGEDAGYEMRCECNDAVAKKIISGKIENWSQIQHESLNYCTNWLKEKKTSLGEDYIEEIDGLLAPIDNPEHLIITDEEWGDIFVLRHNPELKRWDYCLMNQHLDISNVENNQSYYTEQQLKENFGSVIFTTLDIARQILIDHQDMGWKRSDSEKTYEQQWLESSGNNLSKKDENEILEHFENYYAEKYFRILTPSQLAEWVNEHTENFVSEINAEALMKSIQSNRDLGLLDNKLYVKQLEGGDVYSFYETKIDKLIELQVQIEEDIMKEGNEHYYTELKNAQDNLYPAIKFKNLDIIDTVENDEKIFYRLSGKLSKDSSKKLNLDELLEYSVIIDVHSDSSIYAVIQSNDKDGNPVQDDLSISKNTIEKELGLNLTELSDNYISEKKAEDLSEITVTDSVSFNCGFTYPKDICTEEQRELYRNKKYVDLQNRFEFNDNDTDVQYFNSDNVADASFNIGFALYPDIAIKYSEKQVDLWVRNIDEELTKRFGAYVNWQGGERAERKITVFNRNDYLLNEFNKLEKTAFYKRNPKLLSENCDATMNILILNENYNDLTTVPDSEITELDYNNEYHIDLFMQLWNQYLYDGEKYPKIDRREDAKVLLKWGTRFCVDDCYQYGIKNMKNLINTSYIPESVLYFNTNQDDIGWENITESNRKRLYDMYKDMFEVASDIMKDSLTYEDAAVLLMFLNDDIPEYIRTDFLKIQKTLENEKFLPGVADFDNIEIFAGKDYINENRFRDFWEKNKYQETDSLDDYSSFAILDMFNCDAAYIYTRNDGKLYKYDSINQIETVFQKVEDIVIEAHDYLSEHWDEQLDMGRPVENVEKDEYVMHKIMDSIPLMPDKKIEPKVDKNMNPESTKRNTDSPRIETDYLEEGKKIIKNIEDALKLSFEFEVFSEQNKSLFAKQMNFLNNLKNNEILLETITKKSFTEKSLEDINTDTSVTDLNVETKENISFEDFLAPEKIELNEKELSESQRAINGNFNYLLKHYAKDIAIVMIKLSETNIQSDVMNLAKDVFSVLPEKHKSSLNNDIFNKIYSRDPIFKKLEGVEKKRYGNKLFKNYIEKNVNYVLQDINRETNRIFY